MLRTRGEFRTSVLKGSLASLEGRWTLPRGVLLRSRGVVFKIFFIRVKIVLKKVVFLHPQKRDIA